MSRVEQATSKDSMSRVEEEGRRDPDAVLLGEVAQSVCRAQQLKKRFTPQ